MERTEESSTIGSTGQKKVEWQNWPLQNAAPWSWGVVAGVITVQIVVWWVTGSIFLSLIALSLLVASLVRFLAPTHYVLEKQGIHISLLGYQTMIDYAAIRSYELRHRGVLLFHEVNPRYADVFQSYYLPWPQDRQEAMNRLTEYLLHLPVESSS